MHRRRALLFLTLVLATAACGKTTPTPSATSNPSTNPSSSASLAPGALAWAPCPDDSALDCASLPVPLDYSKPSGPKETLALIRQRASNAAARKGSIVVNPGGPGGSGLEFLKQGGFNFGALSDDYDIVSFDPRGVGSSSPSIHCLTSSQMDALIAAPPAPQNPQQVQTVVSLAQEVAAGCEHMSGSVIPYVGTANAARDMDQIRQALGEPKLNYLGFSYGTYLGAVYATEFPTKVGLMVLDGAVDPTLTQAQIAHDQSVGFEDNLNAALAACANDSTCAFYNGGHPQQAYDALMARIASDPLAVGSRRVGSGEAFLGVLASLYSPQTWSVLYQALASAQRGNGAVLLELADLYDERQPNGTYTNELDANTAINCDDGPAPPSLAGIQSLAAQLSQVAPHFGASGAYGPLTCDYWPFPPLGRVAINDTGAPTIIVVGGTHDPATPYVWAQSLNHQLAGSVLVTRNGYGHVSYDKSTCVSNLVNAFFISHTVPDAGVVCQSDNS